MPVYVLFIPVTLIIIVVLSALAVGTTEDGE